MFVCVRINVLDCIQMDFLKIIFYIFLQAPSLEDLPK